MTPRSTAREISSNVAALVLENARRVPERVALVVPRGDTDGHEEVITYGGLAMRIAQLSAGLARAGMREGDRAVLLFPVSVDFYALSLAVLASGMTVVLIDGALGLKRTLVAIEASRARAIVSVRAAMRLWPVLPPTWRAKRFTSDAPPPGVQSLDALLVSPSEAGEARALARRADDEALVTFTSGSSGRPKGADRTHGLLVAQHHALREECPDEDGEVDMPCFPAVGLHDLCCGMTTVLPPVDLRRPASVDPARVLRAIARWKVTRMSGAPAYMDRIASVMAPDDERVRGMRCVAVGGAPIGRKLAAKIADRFARARSLALYGSTEAEPIASTTMREIASARGEGYLVGRVAPVAEVELVRLPEIAPELDARGLAPYRVASDGSAGADDSAEVVVRGPHVNRRYVGDDEANRRLKIPTIDGDVWHRTGDLARQDDDARLWLTGRTPDVVVHRGKRVLPYAIEADAGDARGVHRAALVAHEGAPDGELAVSLEAGAASEDARHTLRALLDARGLERVPIRVVEEIPTDARHQSKTDRASLRLALRGR